MPGATRIDGDQIVSVMSWIDGRKTDDVDVVAIRCKLLS